MMRAAALLLPLAGWLLLLLLTAGGSRACLEIPGYRGTLSEAAVAGWTLQQDSGGTCQCCGLCHQHHRCHSLSYRADTGQCRLFDQVASYSTFQRSFGDGLDAPRYYVMPGRSERGQFCRETSDCTSTPALSCVAHICTDDPTVTCLDVLKLSGTALLDGFHWGAVQGRTLPLSCYKDGFTLLLTAKRDFDGWTEQNWRNLSEPADPGFTFQQRAYSIMGEAERIRDSEAHDQFQIILYGSYTGGDAPGGIHGLNMTLARAAPLLARSPPDQSLIINSEPLDNQTLNPISGQHTRCILFICGGVSVQDELTVPYHRDQIYLLTTNTQPQVDDEGTHHDYGTLIKDDGDIRWKYFENHINHRPDFVKYYIRE